MAEQQDATFLYTSSNASINSQKNGITSISESSSFSGSIEDGTFLVRNTFIENSQIPEIDESLLSLFKSGGDDSHIFKVNLNKIDNDSISKGRKVSFNKSRNTWANDRRPLNNSTNRNRKETGKVKNKSNSKLQNVSFENSEEVKTNPFRKPRNKNLLLSLTFDSITECDSSVKDSSKNDANDQSNPFRSNLKKKDISLDLNSFSDNETRDNSCTNNSTIDCKISNYENPFLKAVNQHGNERLEHNIDFTLNSDKGDDISSVTNNGFNSPTVDNNPFMRKRARKSSLDMSLNFSGLDESNNGNTKDDNNEIENLVDGDNANISKENKNTELENHELGQRSNVMEITKEDLGGETCTLGKKLSNKAAPISDQILTKEDGKESVERGPVDQDNQHMNLSGVSQSEDGFKLNSNEVASPLITPSTETEQMNILEVNLENQNLAGDRDEGSSSCDINDVTDGITNNCENPFIKAICQRKEEEGLECSIDFTLSSSKGCDILPTTNSTRCSPNKTSAIDKNPFTHKHARKSSLNEALDLSGLNESNGNTMDGNDKVENLVDGDSANISKENKNTELENHELEPESNIMEIIQEDLLGERCSLSMEQPNKVVPISDETSTVLRNDLLWKDGKESMKRGPVDQGDHQVDLSRVNQIEDGFMLNSNESNSEQMMETEQKNILEVRSENQMLADDGDEGSVSYISCDINDVTDDKSNKCENIFIKAVRQRKVEGLECSIDFTLSSTKGYDTFPSTNITMCSPNKTSVIDKNPFMRKCARKSSLNESLDLSGLNESNTKGGNNEVENLVDEDNANISKENKNTELENHELEQRCNGVDVAKISSFPITSETEQTNFLELTSENQKLSENVRDGSISEIGCDKNDVTNNKVSSIRKRESPKPAVTLAQANKILMSVLPSRKDKEETTRSSVEMDNDQMSLSSDDIDINSSMLKNDQINSALVPISAKNDEPNTIFKSNQSDIILKEQTLQNDGQSLNVISCEVSMAECETSKSEIPFCNEVMQSSELSLECNITNSEQSDIKYSDKVNSVSIKQEVKESHNKEDIRAESSGLRSGISANDPDDLLTLNISENDLVYLSSTSLENVTKDNKLGGEHCLSGMEENFTYTEYGLSLEVGSLSKNNHSQLLPEMDEVDINKAAVDTQKSAQVITDVSKENFIVEIEKRIVKDDISQKTTRKEIECTNITASKNEIITQVPQLNISTEKVSDEKLEESTAKSISQKSMPERNSSELPQALDDSNKMISTNDTISQTLQLNLSTEKVPGEELEEIIAKDISQKSGSQVSQERSLKPAQTSQLNISTEKVPGEELEEIIAKDISQKSGSQVSQERSLNQAQTPQLNQSTEKVPDEEIETFAKDNVSQKTRSQEIKKLRNRVSQEMNDSKKTKKKSKTPIKVKVVPDAQSSNVDNEDGVEGKTENLSCKSGRATSKKSLERKLPPVSYRTNDDIQNFAEMSASFDVSMIKNDKNVAEGVITRSKSTPKAPSKRVSNITNKITLGNASSKTLLKDISTKGYKRKMSSTEKPKRSEKENSEKSKTRGKNETMSRASENKVAERNEDFAVPLPPIDVPDQSNISYRLRKRKSVTFRSQTSLIGSREERSRRSEEIGSLSNNSKGKMSNGKIGGTKKRKSLIMESTPGDGNEISLKQKTRKLNTSGTPPPSKTKKNISDETSLDISSIVQPKQRKLFHSTPNRGATMYSMNSLRKRKTTLLSDTQPTTSSLYTTTESDIGPSESTGPPRRTLRSNRVSNSASYDSHRCNASRTLVKSFKRNVNISNESSCFNRPPDSITDLEESLPVKRSVVEECLTIEMEENIRDIHNGTLHMSTRNSRASITHKSVYTPINEQSEIESSYYYENSIPIVDKSESLISKFSRKRKTNDSIFGKNKSKNATKKANRKRVLLPKLAKPAPWIKKELYTFLEKKLIDNYPVDYRFHAEKIVILLNNAVSNTLMGHPEISLETLKAQLIQYDICRTYLNYYTFIRRYTPLEFIKIVVPLGRAYGNDNFKYEDVKALDLLQV